MAFDPSHLDTSVGALIRSGAAVLGILLGSFVLAARPRTRLTKSFGTFLVIDGVAYAIFALAGGFSRFPHKELIIPSHVASVTASLVTAVLLLTAFWPQVRRLPSHRPEAMAGLVAAGASLLLNPFQLVVAGERPPFEDYGSELRLRFGLADAIAFSVYLAALALVGAALLATVRRDRDAREARAHLLLATHCVLSTVILSGVYVAIAANDDLGWTGRVGFLVTAAALLVLPLCFLGLGTVGGWSRWLPVALVAAAFATPLVEAVLLAGDLQDGGFGGIVTLVGMLAIGYAIFRLDLLGVPVPRPRAGALAALGLAALFITAQVAQNFLSDGLGLLWGGVVAGIVVFAAGPLQRRMERRATAGDGEGHFGKALRLALRDRRLTAAEERDLILLAERLGVANWRAYELMDEAKARQRRRST